MPAGNTGGMAMRIVAMAAAMALLANGAGAQERVEVMIGGAPGLDACMSQGKVAGLNPAGDNFLTVRRGPGTSFAEVDRLGPGAPVNLCDERNGWHGIVYGENCGVSSPADHAPYRGPCKSGWVSAQYINVTAG